LAKRLRLKIDYFEGYNLLSIASQLKDYRLTFFINDVLDIDLKKYDDLEVTDREGDYSWYYFSKGENYPTFYLVFNNHEKGKLIPSQKGIDYYLFIKDCFDDDEISRITALLRKISGVLGVFRTDMESIKNMDSILEALELHELEKIIKPSSNLPGSFQ